MIFEWNVEEMQLQSSSAAAVAELGLTALAFHVITAVSSLDVNLQYQVHCDMLSLLLEYV